MKFRFIEMNRTAYPVQTMCQLLAMSASGYYAWRKREKSVRARDNGALVAEIRAIHAESNQVYGSLKVQAELRRRGRRVNHKRVAQLMRQNGLKSRRAKKYKVTTNSAHGLPIAPNLLNREFRADQPNTKWVSDITYVYTREGWMYLAVVLDLFSRRVVGWAMQIHMTCELVMAAFQPAARSRGTSRSPSASPPGSAAPASPTPSAGR